MDVFLTAGIVLGLSSGFSPGPLTTLVISQSLQHGAREGVKVSLAPFVTDLPIILLSVFALSQLSDFQGILGLISIIGGLLLVYLAYASFKTDTINLEVKETASGSLAKGSLVNFLNPSPYLFWLTIGAPTVVAAWSQGPWIAAAFFAGFYVCLVGAKISMAYVAAGSRRFLIDRAYGYVMKILGVLLLAYAVLLFRDGAVFLNLFSK